MNSETIEGRLGELSGWRIVDGALQREWVFKDFAQAFAFMSKVAAVAEQMNHHPDWSNVYNRVTIRLTSHEAGGVSDRDFDLATRINELTASS